MKEKKSMVLIRYNLRLYAYWQWSTRWIVLPLMNNSCSILIGPFTLCVGNLHQSRTMWAFVILKLVFVCCFFCWVWITDSCAATESKGINELLLSRFHLFILCTVVMKGRLVYQYFIHDIHVQSNSIHAKQPLLFSSTSIWYQDTDF